MKKILIINQPLGNRGDEAAHKALVRSILRFIPNAKIDVLFISSSQECINQFMVHNQRVSYINIPLIKGGLRILLYKILNIFLFLGSKHPILGKIIPLYKNADLVLCAPGGICMGGFQDWGHISLLCLAKCLNKPIAYYGRSIGPFPTLTFRNRMFKKKSLELLHYFSFTSLREEKSMKLAKSLNVNFIPTVDSAFLETPITEIPKQIKTMLGTKPYVVFVPNKLIWHYAYKGKVSINGILSFYKRILDIISSRYPNHNIVMLPQTYNLLDKDKGDINFFRELEQYTQNRNLIIIPDIYNSDIQQTIISKAECMIGARYHSVVFAINQGVPFVALSYEHKICGLLETVLKTDSMVDIASTFDSDKNIEETIAQFEKKLYTAHNDKETQQIAQMKAKECFDKFINFYKKI
jgi:colanic acid/amylovoran biosynthesis protein